MILFVSALNKIVLLVYRLTVNKIPVLCLKEELFTVVNERIT
jgi:hypothetical protein